jgi:hypothetical protein
MNAKQLRTWYKIGFALASASLFGLLACLTLVALPASAADGAPTWRQDSSPPAQPAVASVFTVTGVVQDQDGNGVEDVQVFAYSGAGSVETHTNDTGHFTLTLTTGIFYDIVFNPPPGSDLASGFKRGVREEQFLTVILPPGHAISGTVYRDATKTTSVANVAIFAFNTRTSDGFGLRPSGDDGTYQVSLKEAPWGLTFTPPPFMDLGPTRTETISLTGDIIKDIILQPGFTVYGQVTTSNGAGQANVDIYAQDSSRPHGYGFSSTDADGYYTGTLPAGTYDIQFYAPPSLGLGSTVITDVAGPPDIQRNLTLPAGYTVSGTVKCGGGLANAFVSAAPQPPPYAGFFGDWGRFAGADGFYAVALQTGVYTFTVSPPGGSSLPQLIVPSVGVKQDMTLNFDYYCIFLPIILKQ